RLEGGFVRHSAQQDDPVDLQLFQRALDGGHAHDVDEQVGGEIARGRDHVVRKVAHAHGAAQLLGDLLGRLEVEVERERLLVDHARELVADVHGRVRGQAPARDLAVDAEEDGQL